ncbi:hypothetical protein KRX19_00010 [Cardiobacteriaceae bacterium TAE3-ERU3]|nr:hypothetical protein [Cardiobacteriaceae bacterium TAE3-ERU3]
MMKQFDINPGVRTQLHSYLNKHSLTLKEAMDIEVHNNEVAKMIHAGLPMMVKKLYSEEKMQNLFWNKRDVIFDFISGRLQVSEAKKVVKKKRKEKQKK